MYDVTIEVRARGTNNDFENNCTVEYKNIKTVEMVNYIQRALSDTLFKLNPPSASAPR